MDKHLPFVKTWQNPPNKSIKTLYKIIYLLTKISKNAKII